MKYWKQTSDLLMAQKTAVTIGKFDGMHKGHCVLVDAIQKEAKEKQLETVVFTFESRLRQVVCEEKKLISTEKEREQILTEKKIDHLIEYPFSDEIRTMSAETFVEEILVKKLNMAFLAVGEDFCFGYKRQGNVELLKKMSEKLKFELAIYPKIQYNKRDISSSHIRTLIMDGKMEDVAAMLGRPYQYRGLVEHGKALGRTIGFPTLNIVPDYNKILPPKGVYFCKAWIQGKPYCAVANIGIQPTVDVHRLLLEVYVLNFSQMIYGEEVVIDLYRFQRPEKTFSGVDALKAQLELDTKACIRFFEEMRGIDEKVRGKE